MNVNWSGCWTLMDREWANHVDAVPLTYRLRSKETTEWRAIGRAGESDSQGILDIGTTGNGWDRLVKLRLAFTHGRAPHAAGIKFQDYDFQTVFPHESLFVEVVFLPTDKHAEALELALIEDYLYRFKDLPPLNSTAGNWNSVKRWMKAQGVAHRLPDGTINVVPVMPEGVLGV